MKVQKPLLAQKGFTLIELLLYVAIVGILLLSAVGFFALSTEARVKNQAISEVNQQGVAAMDNILQSIRNATAVTAPALGATGSSLTLTVPTAALSPTIFDLGNAGTVMGYSSDGGSTDINNSNFINATKFTASASGTISVLYAMVGPVVAASPNNKSQMAIYSGTASAPTTLLASSGDTALTPNAWNAFGIAPVNVVSGQVYWLGYNTNGTASTHNDLRYHTGTTNQSVYIAQTYNGWPSSWTGGTMASVENSMYAPIASASGTSTLQIKEGTGAALPLTNDKVQITGLTIENLGRAGTNGVVQVSFTASRKNPTGRNEYNYRKVFTGSAEVQW